MVGAKSARSDSEVGEFGIVGSCAVPGQLDRHRSRLPPRLGPIPSRITVHRILVRHGLVVASRRPRRRDQYRRWERGAPMEPNWVHLMRDTSPSVGGVDHGRAGVPGCVEGSVRGFVATAVCRRALARLGAYGFVDDAVASARHAVG
jgi:hypothetical protein